MLVELKEKIKDVLVQTLKNNDWILLLDQIVIEETKNSKFGFLNTNLPYLISATYKKNLEELKKKLLPSLQKNNDLVEISKIEFDKGYLNFYPSPDLIKKFYKFAEESEKIAKYKRNSNKLKKYFIEIISANPTGELHIGHIRNGVITDSLANLLEYDGNSVYRAYLVNDAGSQIKELIESIHLIYSHLVKGSAVIESQAKYYSEIIKKCAKAISLKFGNYWKLEDKEATSEIKKFSIDYLLDSIKAEMKELSIVVDSWDYESQICTEASLASLIDKLKENIYINEKALWFNTSKFSEELNKDDVLVKKDGTITYFCQDLIYHLKKIDFLGSNSEIINVLAQDHSSHITRMKSFFKAIQIPEEMIHYKSTQLSRLLVDGKKIVLSKRDNVYLNLAELKEHLNLNEIRWLLSSRNEESELDIEVNKLKERNYNNPIFYILYAYSRAASLIESIKIEPKSNLSFEDLSGEKELDLIYAILSLELHYKKAIDLLKPSVISSYLFHLAQKFHSFYEAFSIQNDSNIKTKTARFVLVKLSHRIFSELLPIFRIQPEKLS